MKRERRGLTRRRRARNQWGAFAQRRQSACGHEWGESEPTSPQMVIGSPLGRPSTMCLKVMAWRALTYTAHNHPRKQEVGRRKAIEVSRLGRVNWLNRRSSGANLIRPGIPHPTRRHPHPACPRGERTVGCWRRNVRGRQGKGVDVTHPTSLAIWFTQWKSPSEAMGKPACIRWHRVVGGTRRKWRVVLTQVAGEQR
jgi:hypothetical protein